MFIICLKSNHKFYVLLAVLTMGVTLLNDSIAPWHHLIFSKTRAIENGCYVVHCANTGFSAIISPAGNFTKK